jgi:xanthine dehydrogenase molybdopterin binding subunit/xanthine dehydrogenase small subunit
LPPQERNTVAGTSDLEKAQGFEFLLNGRTVRIQGVSPNTTLLEYLRNNGRTGTKEGCAEGDCGACSVAIVEMTPDGRAVYRAVNSCLLPVCLLAGREVITVEGIGCPKRLHPVQASMMSHYGSQCGYCTPGFVCSLFEGYYRDDLHSANELDEQLAGNLCRCTGYRPICDAAAEAFSRRAAHGDDPFAARLQQEGAMPGGVNYDCDGEKFFRPVSLAELFRLLSAIPDAKLIAGATEIGLEITKRHRKFSTLISTEAVVELKVVECTPQEWRIGAAVTLTEIGDRLGREFPMFADMLRVFGSRQIRNRATMGGNLVTASPIGDSAPVLLALDGGVVLASSGGERTLPIGEFFTAYRQTSLQPGEILKTIIIPRGASQPQLARKSAWFKVSKRREMDISTVAGAFVLDLDSQNVIRHARLGYAGVAAMPVRARKTEAALIGKIWEDATLRATLPILGSEFTPISDVRGSAGYRSGLIISLLEKFYFDSMAGAAAKSASALSTPIPALPDAVPHESAHKHVTGEAIYTDDLAARRNMLETWPVCAPHARAKILRRDASAARTMPGVKTVLMAEDIPGLNDVGAVRHDEILLADNEVFYHGQIIALVVGESQEACRHAAAKVVVEYEPLPPILTIEEAIAQNSFHTEPNFIRRGDAPSALSRSPHVLEGDFEMAGQEHFYLEMQAAWAEPGEDGSVFVVSSTQHPSEVQHVIAHVLAVPVNHVVVQSQRMGGGFGGKETQAATFAALAALAAARTQRAVRVRVNRDLDMMITGKRHPFFARFSVGYNDAGDLLAAKIELISNGGWSLDLSMPVTDRAVFHLDNSYYLPAAEFSGRVAKTNLASNTAFRGFGGPQGMLVIEEIIDRIAHRLGKSPEEIRERNLYRGAGETNTTHYGQEIEDNRLQTVWHELKKSSAFETRRVEIAKWNAAHAHCKRGLAMTPVKFGISFTLTHLNQAGALVLIFQDGTVQVNHGATEMGQGVHTNIAMVAAKELGVSLDKVRVMPTSTDKVPNTSATAASCGTDLNGMAVKNACEILRARLAPVAARMLSAKLGRELSAEQIAFANSYVFEAGSTLAESVQLASAGTSRGDEIRRDGISIPFDIIVQAAYAQRIGLSSTGFYRTPEIHYDRAKGQGRPFYYFAVGAAVTEVELDGFTGMAKMLRTDILHDAGDSINPGINMGQIEGGFVQGAGWLTCEELVWNDKGVLLTHSPDTYKIPAVGDRPLEFNVQFLTHATQKGTIHGSKAVGEPPLMLAISVREAIRDAIAAFGSGTGEIALPVPATGEAIWRAIQKRMQPPFSETGRTEDDH